MTMHASTVRFGDDLWAEIEREAAREGVSVAQFVRDAALLRVATLAARRGDDVTLATLDDLAARPGRRRRAPGLADPGRVAAVRSAQAALGPVDRAALDRLGELARQSLGVPVSLVSLIGDELQHPLSCRGLRDVPVTIDLDGSVCRFVVEGRGPLVVADTRALPDLAPMAGPPARVVAYLGVPLITDDGHALGALAVLEHEPRAWSDDDVALVLSIAQSVVTELERARDARGRGSAAAA